MVSDSPPVREILSARLVPASRVATCELPVAESIRNHEDGRKYTSRLRDFSAANVRSSNRCTASRLLGAAAIVAYALLGNP